MFPDPGINPGFRFGPEGMGVRPAASLKAVVKSPFAVLKREGLITAHGGPLASTAKIVPFTWAQVTPMADPAIGLAPTSPLIVPPPVVVIAAPDRITKLAVERRSTGAGPAASKVPCVPIKATARTRPMSIGFVRLSSSARDAGDCIPPAAFWLERIIIVVFIA